MAAPDTRAPMATFEEFVETALPRLVRFATWVGGSSGDPEDLVQDALERVGMRWRSLSGDRVKAEAYVRRAIVNGNVDRWRARRREHLVDVIPEVAARGAVGDPRHGEVWLAVMSLPRGQRAVIVLRFFEELSVAETAAALGLAEGTVKAHTHRALESLRESLRLAGQAEASAAIAASAGPLPITAPGAGRGLTHAVGSRRRRRNAAIAAAAMLVAVVVVLAGWPFASGDRVQPVVPAPSVAVTTPTPTGDSDTATTGARNTGTSPTTSRVSATQVPTTQVPATQVDVELDGYRFALEGLASPPDDFRRRDDLAEPWPIDPCRPTTYPTDARRSDFAFFATAQDTAVVAGIGIYPDAATASEVVAGFSRTVAACGRVSEPTPSLGSGVTQWATFTTDLGDESLGFLETAYEPGEMFPGSSYVVVRTGRAVLVVQRYSPYDGAFDRDLRISVPEGWAATELPALQAALR